MSQETTDKQNWAILELMGHRRHGGIVNEVQIFGVPIIHIKHPLPPVDGQERWGEQYYNPSALYCLTPCTEQEARDTERDHNWPYSAQRQALLAAPEHADPFAEDADDLESRCDDQDEQDEMGREDGAGSDFAREEAAAMREEVQDL